MSADNNADRNLRLAILLSPLSLSLSYGFFVSVKKMEGDDGLRTLECLRGRLLAERAASRVAKEEAVLMGNKLIELENQLRLEIKFKNKAEKKLNFLKKKLESLKINYATENSEEDQNPKPQFTDSEKCSIDETNYNSSEITSSNQDHTSPSSEESSSPQNSANSNHNFHHKDDSLENFREPESIQSCEDSNNNDYHSLNSSMGGNVSVEEDENVDNSLALVLVPQSLQLPSQKAELSIVNKSVGEVLDALRHAREMLQSSMERRHTIKLGSIETQICCCEQVKSRVCMKQDGFGNKIFSSI